MKNTSKITIGLLLSVLMFSGESCPTPSAVTPKTCGDLQTANTTKTLTISDPQLLVQSGAVASPSSSCEMEFFLNFYWADTARAETDTAMPPLPNLKYAFHVNSDNLSYPADTPNPNRVFTGGHDRFGNFYQYYEWSIVFHDHYSSDTAAANFYIKASLASANPADSVIADGTVYYYLY